MSFGGPAPNKAAVERRTRIHAGNCMACSQRGINLTNTGYVQWHHLRGRKHHMETIGLCAWHHQAQPLWGYTHAAMREDFGPSLAEGSKPFHVEFGGNPELLQMQNELLGDAK